MKIATTIEDMYPFAASPAEAVRQYRDTGFRYLDYSFYTVLTEPGAPFMADNWRDGIRATREAADEMHFRFVQAHAPRCRIIGEGNDLGLEATVRSIEACGMLGIRNMVIHSEMTPAYKYPEDKLAYFRGNEPFFRALIPAMEEHNVHILFENTSSKHCRDRCFFPITAEDLNDFVAFMDHPLFGAAWDVGHAHMDGLDHQKEIMTLGRNLRAVHIHDNDGQKDLHTLPFLGTLNFDSLLRGLIDVGFDGFFTLETDRFFEHTRCGRLEGPTDRLAHPTLEIKRAALSLSYLVAKTMLSAYGVFEE